MPPDSPRTGFPRLAAAGGVLLLLLVVLVLPQRYPGTWRVVDEAARIDQALTLLDGPPFCLPEGENAASRREASASSSAAWTDRDGCLVLARAPLLTLLSAPLLAALPTPADGLADARRTWLLALGIVTLPTLGLFALVRRRLSGSAAFAPGTIDLALLALLIATPMLAWAGLFVGHALGGAFVLLGVVFAFGAPGDRATSVRRQAVGGLSLGVALLAESTAWIPIAAVLAWMAIDGTLRRRLSATGLGLAVPVIVLLAWNQALVGHPLGVLLRDPLGVGVTGPPADAWRPLDALAHAAAMLFHPSRGLFFHAPWLVVALPALWMWTRRTDLDRSWRIGLPFVLVTSFAVWSMGSEWEAHLALGPRQLAPILPLLALPLAGLVRPDATDTTGRRFGELAVVSGIAYAALIHLVAAGVHPWFPRGLENPLYQVVVPVLIESGPGRTIAHPAIGPWAGVALQCGAAALLLALATRGVLLRSVRARRLAVLAVPVLVLVQLATGSLVGSQDSIPSPNVLRAKLVVYSYRGDDYMIAEYRSLILMREYGDKLREKELREGLPPRHPRARKPAPPP